MVKHDESVERVDGDGKISAAELRQCLLITTGEEISEQEAEAVVKLLDSDGDGFLGLEDFVGLMVMESRGEEELEEAFGMYVMEGSENITPKSLKRMLSRLGEKKSVDECVEMIDRFDLNGDGVLNFDEFVVMMR